MSEINRFQKVAEVLSKARQDINTLLTQPEDDIHRMQITNGLQRMSDQLLLLTGNDNTMEEKSTVLGPAKTIGGKPISKMRKITDKDLIPSDDKVHQLREAVESATEYFRADRTPESLIAQIPDLVIRGVAKKAGFTVTKDNPAVLTPEFVGKVQEKVKELYLESIGAGDHEIDPDEGEVEEIDTDPLEAISKETLQPGTQGKLIKLPEHVEKEFKEGPATTEEKPAQQPDPAVLEREAHIASLQSQADAAFNHIEELKAKYNKSRSKETRGELVAQITDAENLFAFLSKQLEDANKN